MESLLLLLGIFYLIVLPILVFIALSRSKNAPDMRGRLEEVERQLRELRQVRGEEPVLRAAKAMPDAFAPMAGAQPVQETAPAPVTAPPPLTPPIIFETPLAYTPSAAKSAPSVQEEFAQAAATAAPSADLPPSLAAKEFSPPPVFAPPPLEPPPVDETAPAEQGAEIRLGARWATRLGIGFLVIAVVFFGIYISQHNPLIRLLEVLAVAGVVTALGLWLERQAREWGQAVFAGGLALFYFAAYAAHAIDAMKVVSSVGLGLTLQFSAVAAITAVAVRRERRHVATMAVFLGMVSCLFALHNDRIVLTLGACVGLLLMAAMLRVLRGWTWPLAAGYLGAQVCFMGSLFVARGFGIERVLSQPEYALWRMDGPASVSPLITLFFPAAFFVIAIFSDILARARGETGNANVRACMVVTAALALGLGGWWGGEILGGVYTAMNLLTATALCLAAGFVYQRRRDLPELHEILYAAAGAWGAVFVVNEYTGLIRWLALMLESFAFGWRVRRRNSMWAWAGLLGTWAVSALTAYFDIAKIAPQLPLWDIARLQYAAWPLASLALWVWMEKAPRELEKDENNNLDVAGVATGLVGMALCRMAWPFPEATWLLLALAAIGAITAFVLRARVARPFAGLMYLASVWILVADYEGAVRWVSLLAETFFFASLLRRRSSTWAWTGLALGWALSGGTAIHDALHVLNGLGIWDFARLQYAAWPMLSLLIWTWVEKSPRETAVEARPGLDLGAAFTAIGAAALGLAAWTNPAASWTFLGLAAAAALLGLVAGGRMSWPTAGITLLFSMWTYQPAAGSSAGTVLWALAAFTAAVLAATGMLASRTQNGDRETNLIGWGEACGFLSLLYAWWVGLSTPVFAPGVLEAAITLGALGLAALSARGSWRTTGDLAYIWAMAALVAAFLRGGDFVAPKNLDSLCLALALALGWLWGALGRLPDARGSLMRRESVNMVLPGFLFAGWTWVALPNGLPMGVQVAMLAAIAAVFGFIGRREWLPGGGMAAALLIFATWVRTMNLHVADLGMAYAPGVVAVVILYLGWLAARRMKFERVQREVVLFFAAIAALAAFDWPIYQMPETAIASLTPLWAGAGAVVFAGGLGARLRSYRFVGLGGLALCLPRVFLVDITDTLGRILAFGALAVVLLAIGFSYQKLRPWLIARDDTAAR